jgi:hypothetical protein
MCSFPLRFYRGLRELLKVSLKLLSFQGSIWRLDACTRRHWNTTPGSSAQVYRILSIEVMKHGLQQARAANYGSGDHLDHQVNLQ